MVKPWRVLFFATLFFAFQAASTFAADHRALTVFAAASLKGPLDDVARAFEIKTGEKVSISYAGSAALARQIEAGAPADIYLSADLKWMDYLVEKKAIDPAEIVRLLGNQLVLVTSASSNVNLKTGPGFDIAGALGEGGFLAMGDPKSVPAGTYAKQALENLGVWADVEKRITSSDNVRVALSLVSRGETPLGIVYQSDSVLDKSVRIVDTFPPNSHEPIIYPAAMVGLSPHDSARQFMAFLQDNTALAIFRAAGFSTLSGS